MSNAIHNQLKIGISGKRNIPDSEWVRSQIIDQIHKILSVEKIDTFTGYSAIATGADSIFAGVVADFSNQPLNVILPFDRQEYGKDFNDEERVEYEKWISNSPTLHVFTPGVPATQEERNEAYFSVGKYIVDHVDYMIIVWDELKPKSKGGTADVLGYSSVKLDWEKIMIIRVPSEKDDIDKQIKSLLKQSDHSATVFKVKHEDTWRYSILFGFTAALCFAISTSFHVMKCTEFTLGIVELFCLIVVYILIYNARTHNYRDKFLEHRLRAEKLRLLDIYHHSDYRVEISEITAAKDKELAEVANNSNEGVERDYYSPEYRHYIITCLITGQLDYHNNRISNKIGSRDSIYKAAANVVYVFFLVVILLHIGHVFYELTGIGAFIHHLYNQDAGLFLSIILPPVIAALHAWIHFNEWHELKEQSKKMIEYLKGQQELLKKAGTDETQYLKVLNAVSASMLADNNAWNIVVSKNTLPHPVI